MSNRPSFRLAASLATVLAACTSPILPGTSEVALTTDRAAYVAEPIGGDGIWREYGFTVQVAVRNVGTGTVFLQTCGPTDIAPLFRVQPVEVAAGSPSGYQSEWDCAGHDGPIRLDPGASRGYEFRIIGPTTRDGHTGEPLGLLSGGFRLGIPVLRCQSVENCYYVPETGWSNRFQVSLKR